MRGSQGTVGAKLSLLLAAASGVCLGQIVPSDSGDYAARVIELTGQVSVLKDTTPCSERWRSGSGETAYHYRTGWPGQVPGFRRLHLRCLPEFPRGISQKRSELARSAGRACGPRKGAYRTPLWSSESESGFDADCCDFGPRNDFRYLGGR